jgi:hypothetical protein
VWPSPCHKFFKYWLQLVHYARTVLASAYKFEPSELAQIGMVNTFEVGGKMDANGSVYFKNECSGEIILAVRSFLAMGGEIILAMGGEIISAMRPTRQFSKSNRVLGRISEGTIPALLL